MLPHNGYIIVIIPIKYFITDTQKKLIERLNIKLR